MKITSKLIGRRVRKPHWYPARWELVFGVYFDVWEGRDMAGKEFIQVLNPQDDDYVYFDPKASDPEPGEDELGNKLI